MICKCGEVCEFSAFEWTYLPDFWICPACDSSYDAKKKCNFSKSDTLDQLEEADSFG